MMPMTGAGWAVLALCLVLVALFVRLGDRYASDAKRPPVKVSYLLEPYREQHSETQEMRYLLDPYRGPAPVWEVIEQ